jgi:hypothetical protein
MNVRHLVQKTWPVLFFAVVCLLAFRTILFTGESTFYNSHDNSVQAYAWTQKIAKSVAAGEIPFWDAGRDAGRPFGGEMQEGGLYPPNLVFVWLFGNTEGVKQSYLEWYVVAHFLFALLVVFALLRRLNISKPSAVIGALVFAFSGPVAVRSTGQTGFFFGMIWVAVALYWVVRFSQHKKWYFLALCGASLAVSMVAGHPQPFYYGAIASAAFLLFFTWQEKSDGDKTRRLLKAGGRIAVVGVLTLVFASPQLKMGMEYLGSAYRWAGDPAPTKPGEKVSRETFTKNYIADPASIVSLINPLHHPVPEGNGVSITLTGLALIIAALLVGRKNLGEVPAWRAQKKFILFLLIFGTIMMLGYWTVIPGLLYYVPGVSLFRAPARYVLLVHIGLTLLVAISAEVLLRKREWFRQHWKHVALVAGLLAAELLYLNRAKLPVERHMFNQLLVLTLLLLAWITFAKSQRLFSAGMVIFVAAAMVLNTTLFLGPKTEYYPPTAYKESDITRFLESTYGKYRVLVLEESMPANIGDVYKIQTLAGFSASLYGPFYDFLRSADKGLESPSFDLFNTRYAVAKTALRGLKEVARDDEKGLHLYERATYYPRALFMDQLDRTGPEIEKANEKALVQTEYSDMVRRYSVTTDKARTALFLESNYPGWRAELDGNPIEIKTAEIQGYPPLFMSLDLPAGEHTLEFHYSPWHL